jgi:hypothetical protein
MDQDEFTNQQDSSQLLQLPTDVLLVIIEQLGLIDILSLRLVRISPLS